MIFFNFPTTFMTSQGIANNYLPMRLIHSLERGGIDVSTNALQPYEAWYNSILNGNFQEMSAFYTSRAMILFFEWLWYCAILHDLGCNSKLVGTESCREVRGWSQRSWSVIVQNRDSHNDILIDFTICLFTRPIHYHDCTAQNVK